MSKRPGSTQVFYGKDRGKVIGNVDDQGLNAHYLIHYLDGREDVRKSFSDCETELEARSWFDGFMQRQKETQPRQWVRIYETLDLIRTTEWYWRDEGFDTFEDWWVANGNPLFGQWAELEQTYSYAKLAAPELFEVSYEEAKALAQSLAKFREVEPAKPSGIGGAPKGNSNALKTTARDRAQLNSTPAPSRKDSSLVELKEYVLDVNHPEFREGFKKGTSARAGEDVYRRFARIRRDSPEVASEFLEGKFVRRYKNGKVEPDLKAAEVAAGIRKEGQPARQRDGLKYCNNLAGKLSKEQLVAHIEHCQSLLLEVAV